MSGSHLFEHRSAEESMLDGPKLNSVLGCWMIDRNRPESYDKRGKTIQRRENHAKPCVDWRINRHISNEMVSYIWHKVFCHIGMTALYSEKQNIFLPSSHNDECDS